MSECRCQIVGWSRDPYEPHIPAQPEWEQADDCPIHPLPPRVPEIDARARCGVTFRHPWHGYVDLADYGRTNICDGEPRVIPGPDRCDAHFGQHPTRADLVAVCTRPAGHPGDHCQILHKPGGESTCPACGRTPTPREAAPEESTT